MDEGQTIQIQDANISNFYLDFNQRLKLDPETQIGLFYLNPFSNPYCFTLKSLNKNPGNTVSVIKCE